MYKRQSEDHKPENAGELARIQRAGGFVEEGRVNGMLALSRALGDFEYKSSPTLSPKDQVVSCFPEVRTEQIDAAVQFVILACDGIWDVKTNQQAVDFMMQKLYKGTYSTTRT